MTHIPRKVKSGNKIIGKFSNFKNPGSPVIEKRQKKELHAIFRLGLSYYNQEQFSFSSNDKKALYYFTKAAELGDCEAQFHLACMYYEKESLKDIEKAFYWWSKVAEQGMPEAQNNLANMYYTEESLKDIEKAFYWYSKAAEQGMPGTTKAVSLFLTSTACSVGYGPQPVSPTTVKTATRRRIKLKLRMLFFLYRFEN